MRVSLPLMASLAAAAPLPALAADYDPPLIVEEAAEYVPVEVGSGWYLRGDIGYTVNEGPYAFEFLGVETDNSRIFGGVGMGYQFTQYLRGELNVGFLSSDSFDATDGVTTVSLDNDVWSGMANVYADLGTIAGFTPYVGAGAGMVYSKSSARVEDTLVPIDFHASDSQYEFAYSLNAGVAYRMSQNLSLDLGYQYLAAPELEYVDVDSLDVKKGVDYHQLKVGLRYELW